MSTRKTADERRRERLGAVIRQHREIRGLSHREAAELADISRRGWMDVESGRTQHPNAGTRRGIERALHWGRGSFEVVFDGGEPTIVEPDVQTSYHDNMRMILRQLGQASPDAVREMADLLRSDLAASPDRATERS